MEGNAEFVAKLDQALQARQAWLDKHRGPQLLESLRLQLANFQGLLDLLVRKGLIRQDPYNYGEKSGKTALPLDSPIQETDKREQVSFRLTALRKLLQLAAAAGKTTTAELDAAHVKQLMSLVQWIPWGSLSEHSSSPTCKLVAQYVNSIRMGSDRVTAVVAKDTVNQLSNIQRQAAAILADFACYHRERWKLEARRKLLPRLATAREKPGKEEEARRAARRNFSQAMPGETFHGDLFDELLAEDSLDRGTQLRDALLARLAKHETTPSASEPKPEKPDRQALLDAVRLLARAQGELASAVATLDVNADRSAGSRRGLRGLLRRLAEAMAGRRRGPRTLEIEYAETDGSPPRRETVELASFLETCRGKVELLLSLADESGEAYRRLASAGDEQLLEFVQQQLSELLPLHSRMAAVNVKLQALSPAHRRSELKGIRLELAAVKNFLLKAVQCEHEYSAKLETLREHEAQSPAHASDGQPHRPPASSERPGNGSARS